MAYGHSSGLPPYEAPFLIAEKRICSFLLFQLTTILGASTDLWAVTAADP